jgi:hypothetical protein
MLAVQLTDPVENRPRYVKARFAKSGSIPARTRPERRYLCSILGGSGVVDMLIDGARSFSPLQALR